MRNLESLPRAYLNKHGVAKCAEVVGKDARIVERWKVGNMPPLIDLQKLIEFDPSMWSAPPAPVGEDDPIGDQRAEGTPLVAIAPLAPEPTPYEWPTGTKIAILMPTNRAFVPGVLKAFAAIYERDKMQLLHPGTDMPLLRARNILAAEFLASGCEWALSWDDDTIPPHGDVEYHRALAEDPMFPEPYIKLHPIGRLLQQKKTLIGGVYFSRKKGGRAQFHGAFASKPVDEAEHRGPRNLVTEEQWVGMGFTLIKREVFTDIMRTQPELQIKDQTLARQLGYSWRFFNPLSITGADSEHSEDVAFCTRAARAGHKTFVDHAISCIHVGPKGHGFRNTAKAVQPLL